MKVTDTDVLYVAALANLALTADEKASLGRDLNAILGYVDLLNEVDTTGIAVSAPALAEDQATSVLRADVVTIDDVPPADDYSRMKRSLAREDALRNAPESDGQYFKVPKVIER